MLLMLDVDTLGDRIRRLREEKGWSLAELVRRAGMKSVDGLWKIEQGKVKNPYSLAGIASALGLSVTELRAGTAEPLGDGRFVTRDSTGRFTDVEPASGKREVSAPNRDAPRSDDRPFPMTTIHVEGRSEADTLAAMIRNLSDADRDRLRRLLDDESPATGPAIAPSGPTKKTAPRDDIEPITPPPKPVKGRPRRVHHPKDKERN